MEVGRSSLLGNGQLGGFATADLDAEAIVRTFEPPRIAAARAQELPPGSALWFVERSAGAPARTIGFDIRASELYCVNHACEPNCRVERVSERAVELVTLEPIRAGDELTIDYAEGALLVRGLWFKCRCARCAWSQAMTRRAVVVLITVPQLLLVGAIAPRMLASLIALAIPTLALIARARRRGGIGGGASAPRGREARGAAAAAGAEGGDAVEAGVLFRAGEPEGVVYRIPVLIRAHDPGAPGPGVLLAFAEARRSVRDWGEISVCCRASADDGRTWGPRTRVLGGADLGLGGTDAEWTVGNPSGAFDAHTGHVLLLLTANRAGDSEAAILSGVAQDTRRVFVTVSADCGRSWSAPAELSAAGAKRAGWTWCATGPGGALSLRAAEMLVPCNHAQLCEVAAAGEAEAGGAERTGGGFVRRRAHVLRIEAAPAGEPPCADEGEAGAEARSQSDAHAPRPYPWVRVGGVRVRCTIVSTLPPWTNECALAHVGGGGVLLSARDMSGACRRWQALSADGGASWHGCRQRPELREPEMHGCHASLASWPLHSPALGSAEDAPRARAAVVAFCNPASGARARLTVRWSTDGGASWPSVGSARAVETEGEGEGEGALRTHALLHAGPAAYSSMQPAAPPHGAQSAGAEPGAATHGAAAAAEAAEVLVAFECGRASPYELIALARVGRRTASAHGGARPQDAAGGAEGGVGACGALEDILAAATELAARSAAAEGGAPRDGLRQRRAGDGGSTSATTARRAGGSHAASPAAPLPRAALDDGDVGTGAGPQRGRSPGACGDHQAGLTGGGADGMYGAWG